MASSRGIPGRCPCGRDNGFYADAVSRVYYAIMHGDKAALESRQVHAASHQGVISQFGLHFVRTDLIDREWGIRLSQSFKGRLAADYDATAEFDETDADQACGRAAAFLDLIRALLGPGLAPGDGDGR